MTAKEQYRTEIRAGIHIPAVLDRKKQYKLQKERILGRIQNEWQCVKVPRVKLVMQRSSTQDSNQIRREQDQ
jgi:hypothetical protein